MRDMYMNKYIACKKGSTMVLLVIAIGVISLLGTSVLGVTMMNYKVKKTNTEIKEAFYMAESGLDYSYAKAYELVSEAVQHANKEAENFIALFSYDNPDLDSLMALYPLCIEKNEEDSELIGMNYTFIEKEIQKQAEKEFRRYYEEYLTTFNYDNKGNDDIKTAVATPAESNPAVTVSGNYEWTAMSGDDKEKMTLSITSEYKNKKNISRTTTVNLIVYTPEYNEPYIVETEVIPVNPFWKKLIVAENLTIMDNNSISFDGDVFINQNVILHGNGSVDFEKDLAVKEDVDMRSSKTINTKNVYTGNILLNGTGAKFLSSGLAVYVRDDLEMNKNGTEVNIEGNYYGFSHGQSGHDKSSSIIINDKAIDKLRIGGKTVLHGSSYIRVNRDNINYFDDASYQTGESLSIVGNYRAYMSPLTNDDAKTESGASLKENNIDFVDYNYLRLADSFKNGKKLNIYDKADYLYFYNEEYKDLDSLLGKIDIRDVYSIGSAIRGNEFTKSTYILDEDIDGSYEREYIKETGFLGFEKDDLELSSGETAGLKFDKQVMFNNMDDIDISGKDSSRYKIIGDSRNHILNEGTNIELIITNGSLDLDDTGNFTGLIVAKGNVNISGNINFKGAIISGGNITIDTAESKNFTYSRDIVLKIIADYNLYKTVFKQDTTGDTAKVTTFSTNKEITEGEKTVNVDFSSLLKFNNWNLK